MKHLILYDLDGTLVDTLADIAEAVNVMLRALGASPVPSREVRRHIGCGVHELVKACLKTDVVDTIEQGVTLYRAHYTAHLVDHSRLYPRTHDVLEYFKTRRQGVITNKPDPYASDILTALGVAEYFFEIVAGNSVYPKKPQPDSLRALMRQAGVGPQDTVFIGDSPIDIHAGRAAGVLTITVRHGFSDEAEILSASPDHTVQDFEELLALAAHERW